jgi:NAD+ synthase
MVSVEDFWINCIDTESQISKFIRDKIEAAGLGGAILAVSGGIDSAVALNCTVEAVGSEKVIAIHMPESDITPHSDTTDVMLHCESLGVTCNLVDITEMLHVIQKNLPFFDPEDMVVCGNIKSRTRMMVSYYFANKFKRMVIGTSNKTELLTGFFTKYGDGGVDIMPLADLYKTQIRQFARYLEIPDNIISKAPSPGFFPGQTDEKELGVNYETLDLVLLSLQKGVKKETISKQLRIDLSQVKSIAERVKVNRHKREFPTILRLS